MVFKTLMNQRTIEQFGAFIQAYTVLNYKIRHPVEVDGVWELASTEDDYHAALFLFSETDDIRDYKLTKKERALLDWLCEQSDATSYDGITLKQITSRYRVAGRKTSLSTARRLVFGRDGKGGLCGKEIPGIYSEKGSCGIGEGKRMDAHYFYVDVGLKSNLDTHSAFCTLTPELKIESVELPQKTESEIDVGV